MSIIICQPSPEEWQKYRDIRLLALRVDPDAFGSSFEEEVNLSETDWRKRINVIWFAKVDGEIAGLIGLTRSDNLASKHCGYIISLWVKPEFRGRGIAKGLVNKLIDWAPTIGLRKLALHVSQTQLAAKHLYEKLGFKEVGFLKENLLKGGKYLDEYLMEWRH